MFNDIIVYTLTDLRDYLDQYLGYEYGSFHILVNLQIC
jgi:hypothetical protein